MTKSHLPASTDLPPAASSAWPGLLSASEAARVMIRERIESGEFPPGARLNPDELGDTLGVSRTPIRDALHQLRTEGLVEIQPRKGVFVRQVPPQEVEEVYALKAAIEPLAAAWAAKRGSEASRAALQDLLEQLLAAGEAGEVRRAAAFVDQIHSLVFTMSNSEVLRDVYNVFHGRVKLLRQLNMAQPGRLAVSLQQHTDIVERIVAGDIDGAREAMARHMADAEASVRKVVS